jgi:GNAT superfamily N-acetyltransferase
MARMSRIEVRPVDAARWDDLVTLFGPIGACAGCWCMWWRIPGPEFSRGRNAGNRAALESLVRAGEPVGLLGYAGDVPVGWAALAPRPAYRRVLRSPALKPAAPDDAGVWAVPCFFIQRAHRRTGVAGALLDAAVAHAGEQGASAVEGYPVDPGTGRRPPAAELYTGTIGLFARAGFTEHARPATGRRVVMRRVGVRPSSTDLGQNSR